VRQPEKMTRGGGGSCSSGNMFTSHARPIDSFRENCNKGNRGKVDRMKSVRVATFTLPSAKFTSVPIYPRRRRDDQNAEQYFL